jgi:Ethanolamine utilization protein EutJ (predicted chaperonin)
LQQRLGSRARDVLKGQTLAGAVHHFELAIKLIFNAWSDSCPSHFEIPLRGAPNIPELSLNEGYLTISKNDLLRFVFLPTFTKIAALVQNQIKSAESKGNRRIKVLFLVGGLGSNDGLANYLKSQIKQGIILKQPHDGYHPHETHF